VTDGFLKDLNSLTEETTDTEKAEEGEEPTPETETEETEVPEGAEVEEEASEQPEVKPAAVKAYTDEEVVQILDGDGKLDSNRLTPTQKLVQRSFARHAEKGYQEIARMKKDIEAVKETSRVQEPPRIDGQIASMATEADNDPLKALKQIAQLQATRNRLTDRQLSTTETKRTQRETYDSVERAILEAVPDLNEKQAKLTEFAINELGYTEEDLARMTDPRMGRVAINTVKSINKAYDAMHGTKEKLNASTNKKKVIKMPIVEGADKKGTANADPALVKMRKATENAKKTGDWTEVLNLKGVLPRLTS
jgi:hypothetical protein